MVLRFFGSNTNNEPSASVPEGTRIYAVGDIHGRVDLLSDLHDRIIDDAFAADAPTGRIAVYLGDYVDRGDQSREVIDLLLNKPLPHFRRVHLRGNHETTFLQFMVDLEVGPGWFNFGGRSTVLSYDVRIDRALFGHEMFEPIQAQLRRNVPEEHVAFLRTMPAFWEFGDYFFCHAGVRPGTPLDEQKERDLLWIRDDFLRSKTDFGKVVVHGHTPSRKPEVRRNRIGIDTGAFATNVLTCLVLEGSGHRFLTTADS